MAKGYENPAYSCCPINVGLKKCTDDTSDPLDTPHLTLADEFILFVTELRILKAFRNKAVQYR